MPMPVPSLRSLVDPGGRSLAFHLDRLRLTVETLASRLRASLTDAVSQAAAGVVRDTLQAWLAESTLSPRASIDRPYESRRNSWDDYDDRYGYREDRYDHREDRYEDDDVYDIPSPRRPQTSPDADLSEAVRWSLALAAGLRAAAWCIEGQPGKSAYLVALGVGSATTIVFVTGGRLTATCISLLLSALSLGGLQALMKDPGRGRNPYSTG
jgi:hypothetical protein